MKYTIALASDLAVPKRPLLLAPILEGSQHLLLGRESLDRLGIIYKININIRKGTRKISHKKGGAF